VARQGLDDELSALTADEADDERPDTGQDGATEEDGEGR